MKNNGSLSPISFFLTSPFWLQPPIFIVSFLESPKLSRAPQVKDKCVKLITWHLQGEEDFYDAVVNCDLLMWRWHYLSYRKKIYFMIFIDVYLLSRGWSDLRVIFDKQTLKAASFIPSKIVKAFSLMAIESTLEINLKPYFDT